MRRTDTSVNNHKNEKDFSKFFKRFQRITNIKPECLYVYKLYVYITVIQC